MDKVKELAEKDARMTRAVVLSLTTYGLAYPMKIGLSSIPPTRWDNLASYQRTKPINIGKAEICLFLEENHVVVLLCYQMVV